MQNGGNFFDVNLAIDNIVLNFKDLTAINLRDNKIYVDVNFVDYKKFSSDSNDIELANFTVLLYQDGKKVLDFSLTGCNLKQPFTFAGYAIPGFDKKIALLLSTKGDCMEGGYINETLYVVGGLENLNKADISNYYKYASALTPNEGTLVVFESDKPDILDVTLKNDYSTDSKNFNFYLIGIGFFVIIIIFLIGLIFKIKKRKN